MNFRLNFFWLILLAFLSHTTSGRAAEDTSVLDRIRARNKVTQIKLQHTKCYGWCPVDELTLNADGSAQFAGDKNSAREGFYRGKIAPEKFATLVSALEEQNFFELRAEIGSPMTFDAPDAIISATRAGSLLDRPHAVIFRASGNYALLTKLQTAFAEASAQIDWQKDEIASKSGLSGRLTRDLTPYEKKLFADREPALTSMPLSYALVELIQSGANARETVTPRAPMAQATFRFSRRRAAICFRRMTRTPPIRLRIFVIIRAGGQMASPSK